MHDVIWEKPPTERTSPSYGWFYEKLKKRQRVWARYPGTQASASSWCDRYPDYEYRSAMVDGERRVWMRYVG